MKILILVDIQNDFLPGGALAVPQGHEVVPVANKLMQKFNYIVATQDWHPRNHGSFASNHPGKKPGDQIQLSGLPQILWPDHCIQETRGAGFASGLTTNRIARIFRKGTDPEVDSYSGFFDNGRRRSTGLEDYLREQRADAVYIVGLATDYCVKATALDSCQLGFDTYLIKDGCRGVNLKPGDSERAIEEMRSAGVKIISSSRVL